MGSTTVILLGSEGCCDGGPASRPVLGPASDLIPSAIRVDHFGPGGVDVTQEHLGWAESMAQALCNPADRDCAVRLISDGLARFEQDILTRPAPVAEIVNWLREDAPQWGHEALASEIEAKWGASQTEAFARHRLTRPAPDGEVVAYLHRGQHEGEIAIYTKISRTLTTGQNPWSVAPLYAHPPRNDAVVEALRALDKILPIRVEEGPDYAEVYFSDGSSHSTQAMTMNPQDWRDIAKALDALKQGDA